MDANSEKESMDIIEDFKKWTQEPQKTYIYQLKHHYSRLQKFCAVRTDMTIDEINVACAYIQLIRYQLPVTEGPEDCIGEEAGMTLLNRLFSAEPVTDECDIDDEVDLYWNWEEYCGGRLDADEINQHYAQAGAYKAVLEIMIAEAQESIERVESNRARKGWYYEGREEEYIQKVTANIPRLQT
ncbi:hypothetical protein CI266_004616, partial [Salmonella enterica subsp. enterica serovar Kotte]|nr:hypothetical protein [Salmonella enterica subsp. enterica serovar Kotte]